MGQLAEQKPPFLLAVQQLPIVNKNNAHASISSVQHPALGCARKTLRVHQCLNHTVPPLEECNADKNYSPGHTDQLSHIVHHTHYDKPWKSQKNNQQASKSGAASSLLKYQTEEPTAGRCVMPTGSLSHLGEVPGCLFTHRVGKPDKLPVF